jgi:hypothetical protein
MRWKIFSGALNAKILIHFFERLARHQEKSILLILDSLRRHLSRIHRPDAHLGLAAGDH